GIIQAAVRGISERAGGFEVWTGGQFIVARRAVVAAGAWTGRLLGDPFDDLLTVRRQVLHWYPVPDGLYRPGAFPTIIWMHGETSDDYFYAFPSVPGSGLLKAATEQSDQATTPDEVDRTVAPAESDGFFRDHLAGRLDRVGGKAVRSMTCLYTVTPDSGFIIDRHPRMERVTVISACSGHGFKHSAGIGESVARMLAGSDADATLAPFALSRFDARPN
ncbi:MAG: FAD-dependent oxidoreductase, partial [Microvirga sp.]